MCTLPLEKEVMKFSVRHTGSQPSSGRDTQSDIFFFEKFIMLHREIKAAVLHLATGQNAVTNRLTQRKCKTQSNPKIDIALRHSLINSIMHYFHGSLPLSEA